MTSEEEASIAVSAWGTKVVVRARKEGMASMARNTVDGVEDILQDLVVDKNSAANVVEEVDAVMGEDVGIDQVGNFDMGGRVRECKTLDRLGCSTSE